MKHLVTVDINQAQRDDLLVRLANVVPNSNGLYRLVLNCTETQRLTALRYFSAIPNDVPILPVLPPVTVDPATIPVLTDVVVPTPAPEGHHKHHLDWELWKGTVEVHLAGSDPEADPDES